MFYEYGDGLYNMVDLYLYDKFFGYEDYYNYYDTDVDKYWYIKKVTMNMLLDITM